MPPPTIVVGGALGLIEAVTVFVYDRDIRQIERFQLFQRSVPPLDFGSGFPPAW
jgi:hypothetical protein